MTLSERLKAWLAHARNWLHPRRATAVAVGEDEAEFIDDETVELLAPATMGLGNATDIHDVLEDLPGYFADLAALRKVDEDAYAMFSQIGGCLAPEGSSFCVDGAVRLAKERPHVRCMFFPKKFQQDSDKWISAACIYLQRMKGGQICVSRSNSMVVLPSEGVCYQATMVYNPKKGGPAAAEFYVNITDHGQVIVLPERRASLAVLPRSRQLHSRGERGVFGQMAYGKPKWMKGWGEDNGKDPDDLAAGMVSLALSAKRPSDAIMVRASKGGLVATWTIDKRNGKKFFKNRETAAATDGKRKRILHYVGEFTRSTWRGVQEVRSHYRGERQFDWQGYAIEISGLGFHHADFFDADIEAVTDIYQTNSRMISRERVGRMLREHYSKPVFLTPRSVSQQRKASH